MTFPNVGHRALMVWGTMDGITVTPWIDGKPDSKRRIFVAGGGVDTLNSGQIRILVDLAYRTSGAHLDGVCVFYDGNAWAKGDDWEPPALVVLMRFDPKTGTMSR